MTGHVRTAVVVGLLVFVIYLAFLTYTPTDPAPRLPEYRETPEERAMVEKRMRYHGLDGHFVVMRESPRGWEFYRERDGQWCKL
jgi:hypothetical protein